MTTISCNVKNFGQAELSKVLPDNSLEINVIRKDLTSIIADNLNYYLAEYSVPEQYKHYKINSVYVLSKDYINTTFFWSIKKDYFAKKSYNLGIENISRTSSYAIDRIFVNNQGGGYYPADYFFAIKKQDEVKLQFDSSFKLYADLGLLETPVVSFDFEKIYVQPNITNELKINSVYNRFIYEQFTIISGTLKYREKGTTGTYTDIPFTGNKAVIPANTFANGKTYECYATCTVDDSQTTDSQVVELTTIDTKPVLKNIAPINSIEYGDVEFIWDYDNESGGEQYAYDLQISTDNISWSNVETHVITSNTKVTKTIQDGTLYWRVKGYNQNDQPSEWSESTKFINRAKPAKPAITKVTSAGRPIIEWESINQIAYELECESFKTGQVYTTDKKAMIEEYLPNRNYVIRLRIFNKFGDSSDWLEFDYSQNMNVPQATATISNTKNGVLINIIENLAYKHYILRDDVLIYKGTNYLDKYVCGTGKYTIRRVDNDDNFSDLVLPYDFVQKEITLVELNGNEHDLGNSMGTISVQSAVMLDSVDVQYLGAEKPTFINGTLTTRQWNLDSVYDRIPLGEIMFLRLFNGDSAWVVASSYGNTSTKSYRTMQVTLKEVYYDESIKY